MSHSHTTSPSLGNFVVPPINPSLIVMELKSRKCSPMLAHARACSPMLAHARTCSNMLAHARPCPTMLAHARTCSPMLERARPCSNMLEHARPCSNMLAHARLDVPCHAAVGSSYPLKTLFPSNTLIGILELPGSYTSVCPFIDRVVTPRTIGNTVYLL